MFDQAVHPLKKPMIFAEQVTKPTDRFFCEPYKCVLTARSCAQRQVAVTDTKVNWANGGGSLGYLRDCRDCADGKIVKASIAGVVDDAPIVEPKKHNPWAASQARKREEKAEAEAMVTPSTNVGPMALPKKPPGARKSERAEAVMAQHEAAKAPKRESIRETILAAIDSEPEPRKFDSSYDGGRASLPRDGRPRRPAQRSRRCRGGPPSPKRGRAKACGGDQAKRGTRSEDAQTEGVDQSSSGQIFGALGRSTG